MELPNYYTALFHAATDAIAAIEQQNYGDAKRILIQGQQQAEELYLEADDKFSVDPLA